MSEDKQQTTAQLHDWQQHFAQITENVPAFISFIDQHGRYQYVSKEHEHSLDKPSHQIIGKTIAEIFGDEIHQQIIAGMKESEEKGLFSFEQKYLLNGEVESWRYVNLVPVYDDNNLSKGCYMFSIDTTNLKKTQQKLKDAVKEIKRLNNELINENIYLRTEVKQQGAYGSIIGESAALYKVLEKVQQVAVTPSTVLIQGETGVGKELIAVAVHNMSPRKDKQMIKVNCAALPATLIESELFGREKGAFTGATSKEPGRFEMANDSTIFLDEIGEIPLELQAKLLRVLQEGTYERIGSGRQRHTNARIIAATNRDLAPAVKEGKFREDLYYRINVFPIYVPPLRERKEDISPLVWSFVREFSDKMGKKITSIPKRSMDKMVNYDWPGNIRELRNVVERSIILTNGNVLQVDLLPNHTPTADKVVTLDEIQKRHIEMILEKTKGKINGKGGAAEILGVIPTTLRSKMEKLGIDFKRNFVG